MEPNPKLSQNDLDKLNRELSNYKKENVQYEINLSLESAKIKELQKELELYKSKIKSMTQSIRDVETEDDKESASQTV